MDDSIKVRLNLTKAQVRKMGRVKRWEQESAFGVWIEDLRDRVIEGEFGYEPGEFTVFPEQWKLLWREGLTPDEAFQRALDGFAEERRREDAERAANWARIQAEDAAARAERQDGRA